MQCGCCYLHKILWEMCSKQVLLLPNVDLGEWAHGSLGCCAAVHGPAQCTLRGECSRSNAAAAAADQQQQISSNMYSRCMDLLNALYAVSAAAAAASSILHPAAAAAASTSSAEAAAAWTC
jgi:hypothetical protein